MRAVCGCSSNAGGGWRPRSVKTTRDEAEADEEARIERYEALRRDDPVAWEAKIRGTIEEYGDLHNAATILEIPRAALRRFLEDPRLADLRSAPADPGAYRR